ncbi:two-component system chemotaxis sensor kinase CheA [Alteromonadaceae bacterium 2753L.S.0a.02]|nr:two-component system chemotaxis sensor kinase CheA [Alteromonadaceae bacterium 2753L.S.0a.02]
MREMSKSKSLVMNSGQMNARELLQQFQIQDTDLQLIRQFGAQKQVDVTVLIDDFYTWLENQIWYEQYFSTGVPPAVQSLQCDYWKNFLLAQVDDSYVKQRVTVGRVHATINLPVTAYLAGMNFAQSWYAQLATKISPNSNECVALLGAINKLIQLDSNIVMHVYSLQSMDTIRRQGELTSRIVREATRVVRTAATGDFNTFYQSQDDTDTLEEPINRMIDSLKRFSEENEKEKWLKSGIADLALEMRGGLQIDELGNNAISFLAQYLGAQVGVLYVVEEDGTATLNAGYAHNPNKAKTKVIHPGEGLVGQVLKERSVIRVNNVPQDYINITSGLGEHSPRNLVVQPLVYDNDVKGIVELGSFQDFSDDQLEFLNQVSESIAVAINSALDQDKMQRLLKVAQQTSEKLQHQQQELETANQTLGEQAQALKQSEEKLTAQRDMLEKSNRELQLKTHDLERQKAEMELARRELEEKAAQLADSSKYKSEFLANMSHELRTPLNSLLLLSQTLMANKEGNFTEDQVEDLRVIHSGGHSLLMLINDILDLSKVEAGKMHIVTDRVDLQNLANKVHEQFKPLAAQKKLEFVVTTEGIEKLSFYSDQHRLEQILLNLLSNAFKFTHHGSVSLTICKPSPDAKFENSHLSATNCIAFIVRDSGIGVAQKDHSAIFQAFQQADGSTSRAYGGTGLGLTISRELSFLLGGEIALRSIEGEGSEFTLYIPLEFVIGIHAPQEQNEAHDAPLPRPTKRTARIQPSPNLLDPSQLALAGRKILLVDDDLRNVYALSKVLRECGVLVLLADNGQLAVEKLKQDRNVDLILMDIMMPVMDGYQAMREIRSSISNSIPIIALTAKAMNSDREKCIAAGASDYMAKPVDVDNLLSKVKTWCMH